MNMTYVSSHLTYTDRDVTGWPRGVTSEEQTWLLQGVVEVLTTHGPLPLMEVYHHLSRLAEGPDGLPKSSALRSWSLWDAKLALVDRALRGAGAEQVWRLEEVR